MNITTKTVHATINCAVSVALLLAASLHAHATDVNGVTEQTVTNNSLTNPLTIENGGILDLNGTTQTVTTTTLGTGGSTLETTNGASMLTSTTVIVQGAGNVVGTLLTLAGPITQNANSGLTVAGTAGSDTLASNAILAGTGSTGALILNGATVSPGTGASPTGNLTVASATFNSNSTLAMTLSSSASSELVVTGAATINGTNSITFTGSTGATTTTGQGNYV